MVVPIIDGSTSSPIGMHTPTAPPSDPTNQATTSDEGAYINFLVTQSNEAKIIRGERHAILESKTELSKVLMGGSSVRKIDGNYIITGTDGDDFELFIRYIETKFIKFRDIKHTLAIIELATRFNCSDLVILCIKHLDLYLTVENVLEIFRALWYYNSIIPTKQSLEGKPKKSKTPPPLITPEEYIAALLHNCLQLIDMESETILASNEILNFRFEELETIAKRDTLQISSEMILFDVLNKWSVKECIKKNLDINSENRRRVLGGMCYYPRYLILSSRDCEKLFDSVKILDFGEINLVRDEFKGKKSSNITADQKNMISNFKKLRPKYARMPIHLSQRSDPKNYPKKMRKLDRDKDDEGGCCSNFTLNCISIFACIFD